MESQINKSLQRNSTLVYKVLPYIRIMAQTLDKAYDDIPPQFKDNCDSHRIKPYYVEISGDPRVRKSKIFQPILVNALAMALGIIDSYQDPQHYCCFRTAGREFWDGGQGKKVVWYNDLYQGMMNEQALDLALEEIAAVVDDNPYHMNMSDVKDKARCYLTAKLVVANVQADTTNQSWLNSRVWSQGVHTALRRNIACVLKLNDQWKKPDGTMDHASIAQFVLDNPEKCYGSNNTKLFPLDLYTVQFLDVKSGLIKQSMSFREAVEHIIADAKNYFARQDVLTNNLKKVMSERWTDQMFNNDNDEEVYEDPVADVAIEHLVRPARRPPLEYNQTCKSRRQLYNEERSQFNCERHAEMFVREQELYRPRRAKLEYLDDQGNVVTVEDIYPENTDRIYDGATSGSIYTHTLSSMTCMGLARYMTYLLVKPMHDVVMDGLDYKFQQLMGKIFSGKVINRCNPNATLATALVDSFCVRSVF